MMAIVDTKTGTVYHAPITAGGIAKPRLALPLLTLGRRVSRVAEVEYRLNSRLMIVRATPEQTQRHPSYEYYFLREEDDWKLLRRVRLPDDL